MIARLLISANLETRVGEMTKILAQVGITSNHPDLLYFPVDSKLGIAEARKIKDFFSLKPYSAKGRVVVLEDASKLTHEAQNALLKTLEELPEQTLFILGANSDAKLLPTVLSRCQIIRLQGAVDSGQKDYTEDIKKLIESTTAERFEYIEKLKDREEFLHSLVRYFHYNLRSHPTSGNSDYTDFLKELLRSEQWAKQNVNIRAILEYLMLVMPHKSW